MRIVIKIGSSTLTHSTGKLNLRTIERLVRAMSDIKNKIVALTVTPYQLFINIAVMTKMIIHMQYNNLITMTDQQI